MASSDDRPVTKAELDAAVAQIGGWIRATEKRLLAMMCAQAAEESGDEAAPTGEMPKVELRGFHFAGLPTKNEDPSD